MKHAYMIFTLMFLVYKTISLIVPTLNSVNLIPSNQSFPIKKLDSNSNIILALTTAKKLINWNDTTYETIPSLSIPVN
jgi:hypothetical protein